MSKWFERSFGSPIDEIRAALIDEAWFGRRAAPARQSGEQPKEVAPDVEPGSMERFYGHDLDR
ncbi:MAG: hypothetical protein V4808_12470 [Pseudomonadota bacterium]